MLTNITKSMRGKNSKVSSENFNLECLQTACSYSILIQLVYTLYLFCFTITEEVFMYSILALENIFLSDTITKHW